MFCKYDFIQGQVVFNSVVIRLSLELDWCKFYLNNGTIQNSLNHITDTYTMKSVEEIRKTLINKRIVCINKMKRKLEIQLNKDLDLLETLEN